MRHSFKKAAESNSNDFENHLGDLLDKTWEVIRVSSSVIDKCLQVESKSTTNNAKQLRLLMMSRNLLSDCCCCLDALERGHERTVFNNLRMILEDLCCIIDASENEKVYIALQNGEHKASKSITSAIKQYPTQVIGESYGMLSKVSHHVEPDLIVRQWVNRDGLLSHIKPFNPNRHQAQLNILISVIHFSRLVGEVAEKLCVEKLEAPYFWTKQKNRNHSPPIDAVVSEIADKIGEKWDFLDSLLV